MNGILKIPMQFFILLCGVLLFVVFQFQKTPIHFNEKVLEKIKIEHPSQYQAWSAEKENLDEQRIQLIKNKSSFSTEELNKVNSRSMALNQEVKDFVKKEIPEEESNDKDYIFLYYILHNLPRGFIGLLIAVILCAAMSSISAELNALSGTTVVDIYKRWFPIKNLNWSDVTWSKVFTIFWGIIAISFALYAQLFENLIQFINIIGSLFYGTVLGIFLVAFYIKQIKGTAVFYAALIAQAFTIYLYNFWNIGFLWYNVIACFNVVVISSLFQKVFRGK